MAAFLSVYLSAVAAAAPCFIPCFIYFEQTANAKCRTLWNLSLETLSSPVCRDFLTLTEGFYEPDIDSVIIDLYLRQEEDGDITNITIFL